MQTKSYVCYTIFFFIRFVRMTWFILSEKLEILKIYAIFKKFKFVAEK